VLNGTYFISCDISLLEAGIILVSSQKVNKLEYIYYRYCNIKGYKDYSLGTNILHLESVQRLIQSEPYNKFGEVLAEAFPLPPPRHLTSERYYLQSSINILRRKNIDYIF